MLNKAMILGNVGKKPEIRVTQDGLSIASFSVATTKKWKNKQNEMVEETQWHKISVFGKLAEIVERYVDKGTQVLVEGEIVTRKWQDKDGKDCYSTEIRGNELKLLGGKAEKTTKQEYQEKAPAPDLSNLDDDLPF